MDANPLDNLNYKWHFNNSLESLTELPHSPSIGSASLVADLGGYYLRQKRKHAHAGLQPRLLHGRHGRMAAVRFEDEDEYEEFEDEYGEEPAAHHPHAQMVYSNMVHKNHVEPNKQQQRKPQQQQMQSGGQGGGEAHHSPSGGGGLQLSERKRLAALHKQQHHRQAIATPPTTTSAPPLNNVYSYHVESYESFGAISCVASSPMGHSQPCWYHIQPAGEFTGACPARDKNVGQGRIQGIRN